MVIDHSLLLRRVWNNIPEAICSSTSLVLFRQTKQLAVLTLCDSLSRPVYCSPTNLLICHVKSFSN